MQLLAQASYRPPGLTAALPVVEVPNVVPPPAPMIVEVFAGVPEGWKDEKGEVVTDGAGKVTLRWVQTSLLDVDCWRVERVAHRLR